MNQAFDDETEWRKRWEDWADEQARQLARDASRMALGMAIQTGQLAPRLIEAGERLAACLATFAKEWSAYRSLQNGEEKIETARDIRVVIDKARKALVAWAEVRG